jgi:ribosomal protein S18 acetylase RimI-like enzyme
MNAALLRLARAEDAAAIDVAGYAGALHHHKAEPDLLVPPSPQSCEWSESALLQSPESVCFVAELAGQAVGYVHATVVTESRPMFVGHRFGRIEAVSVLPQFQSLGVGTSLLEAAEEWLALQGCKVVRLSVFAANSKACALYAARGYEPVVTFLQRKLDNGA